MQARRPSKRGIIILVVVAILAVILASTRFYTDVLWFQEVGLSDVLWTTLRTQFLVGLAVGAFVALLLWVNLLVASKARAAYRVDLLDGRGRDPLDQLRDALSPYAGWIRVAIALLFGIVTGIAGAASWQTFLLWSNRVPFGVSDPQFGKDVGFYVFELPLLNAALDQLWFVLFLSLIVTLGAYWFYGAIRPERGLAGVAAGALAHLSVLLGLMALVKAVQYWLGQYSLNFSERGVTTGASYTDVNAQLPALKVLAAISIVSALLFLVNIRARRLSLPLAAVAMWILVSILAGGVWPFLIQRFSVAPQEAQREEPFIERNIEATRQGFQLDDVETQDFGAANDLSSDEVRNNEALLQNVRVWDPPILQQVYAQIQAIRTYYQFNDVDVDRYTIDGTPRQILLSARELSLDDLPEKSKKWANLHLQYTHGFGLVASLANESTAAGAPSFLVKDIPGVAREGAEALSPEQARIYYGENFDADEYSVVNSGQAELDYATEEGVERSSYEGRGGISVGSFLKRLAFAIREGDPNLVLSSLIEPDSRILIYRNVRDRVRRAAPFLSLDNDPYPAVVDDRVVWILDAYTSTHWYPYSQRANLSEVVDQTAEGVLHGDRNYVRNSVKVVVDAYDGTMQFYIVDDNDPLIQAWRNAFPDLFRAGEPSADLRAHFRYPEDLFNVQSSMYLTYHMTDPQDFYAKEDEWALPSGRDEETVSPSYLLTRLPNEAEQEFLLIRPFTPRARNNMIALMAARSDPEHYGELVTLQFPRSRQVPGPTQVDNVINQDVTISQTLTLLGQEGSIIQYGKLVILPVEDSILYIQPLFVTAENIGIPELKKVAVVGDRVVLADTFEEALADLFGLDADEPREPSPGATPRPGREPQPGDEARLDELVARAAQVYERAQEALADGDFAAYGRLIDQLGGLLERAARLSR